MEEKFTHYLKAKGVSDIYLKRQLEYFRLFIQEDFEDSQNTINEFLMKHTNGTAKAFVKHFLEMNGLEDLYKVPKFSGRTKKIKRKIITDDKAKVLRAWLLANKNYRYVLMFDITEECGLRRAETMAIKLDDFDWEAWVKDIKKPCKLKIHGKGNRERYVLISSKLALRVAKYLKKHTEIIDKLFPFNYTKWHDAFKDSVKATQDYNFTLHDLRRRKATKWMQDNVNIYRIKNRMGHSNINTTLIYINPDEEKELEDWENELIEEENQSTPPQ